ncbi:hypothetical protein Y695_02438 [Hydrogenophaga sp. T4]|nr:hypothetical protein Y695_02438 [Hydrogenophaga sp. T4]
MLISKASGLSPVSASSTASFLPTMLAMRLPMPMSDSSSLRVLLPVKRSSFSQVAL